MCRRVLTWILVAILPASLQAADAKSAILHSQGGVWVNGMEAADASAVFPGDLLETKPGFSATLDVDGSTVSIQQESVVKFDDNLLILDHGNLLVGTTTGMRVRVHCINVIPVSSAQWTQYEVTDVNGSVQVAAHKNDVRIELEGSLLKTPVPTATPGGASGGAPGGASGGMPGLGGTTVHEGEQATRRESEVCAAPPKPASASGPLGLSPKWIATGAGGAGILICLLAHCFGGGSGPVSPSQP
ncbi:MAG TPA: hypothetical protein VKR60_11815 [Candidatus Sulfotelmatobacter sp.]|nr:hypothetical protein [Candidatus Sulfotelmatobacter sp.]